MSTINLESKNINQSNIQNLKALFPEAFISGKCNIETLQELIGEELEDRQERYGLNWNGKAKAKRIAGQTTTSTLVPDITNSKDWDKTKNVFIEGDNLEVLKVLQKSYQSQIKMIYIDPPYNTGKDFVYADNFNDNLQNYLEYTAQTDTEGRKLSTNPESDGRYHDKWLSMMYPRLKLAKELLSEDGVLFASIDDWEVDNLRKILDEIFGEDNVDIMIWRKSGIGRDGKMKFTTTYRKDHEYILVAYKNTHILHKTLEKPNFENEYGNPDNDIRGCYKAGSISRKDEASNPDHENYYTVISQSGKKITRQFEVSEIEFNDLNNDGRIYWGKDGDAIPAVKIFVDEERKILTSSLFLNSGTTTDGSKEIDIFFKTKELGKYFRPKPTELIKRLAQIGSDKDSVILDFFAGSGTTAQAVMELNAKDGGNRKFICVQLPEPILQGKGEQKEAYDYCISNNLELNIASLTKERIKKAGEKIAKENPLSVDNMDLGFRTFRLADTNFTKWNKGVIDKDDLFKEMDKQMAGEIDVPADNLFYETLLKDGIDLALSPNIAILELAGQKVYSLEEGKLLVCMDKNVSLKLFDEVLKLDLKPSAIICLESSFVDDEIMINTSHLMEKNNIKFKTI